MKRLPLFIVLFLLSSLSLMAQILQPISWKKSMDANNPQVGDEITLTFTASIEKDWYLYSSDFDPELGPQVTTFTFAPSDSYELVGDLTPIKPKKKYDDLWEGEYTYFIGTGKFQQKVKILKEGFSIKANASYQVCTDITGRCIPLQEEFSFTGNAASKGETVPTSTQKDNPDENASPPSPEKDEPLSSTLLEIFLLAFGGGLISIFTPCVFPMIPLTVSFFTKKANARKKGIYQALVYGSSIVIVYTLVGVLVTPIGGPQIANVISTHWLPNALFFTIFFVFALSFFGMFDIVLPNSLVNNIDKQADKGGFFTPFFMALTLVVVSFSCTGPIAGSLIFMSAGGDLLAPAVGMFGFGLAFALPFTTFAFFPPLLNKMPKSGGWLNSVKVTLGFIELALAFKFLSMIDLVYHWGILDRDINIAIWIAIASFMGLYYLGKIRLPHDSPISSISVPRMLLALVSFSFVVYLIPGMFGAPLKALSGVLPPQTHHDFDIAAIIRENAGSSPSYQEKNSAFAKVKHENLFELPHGLQGYFDYEEGIQAAKAQGKPVFVDFTGHGCANCRKMEDNVWVDNRVLETLQNEFVIIALYVDDRTELPESEWRKSSYDGKMKKTIGAINMDIQISEFENNAQPFYTLLDQEGELLINPPIGYEPNADSFLAYLQKGIAIYKDRESKLAVQ